MTLFPPSMTVVTGAGFGLAYALVQGGRRVSSMGMVTSPLPQSNVITPPACTAALSAAKVQLSAVPVPTTLSGAPVSTSAASAGSGREVQLPSGFPASGRRGPSAPARSALQLTFAPPSRPEQLQVHGPEPSTWEAVPTAQRSELGAWSS